MPAAVAVQMIPKHATHSSFGLCVFCWLELAAGDLVCIINKLHAEAGLNFGKNVREFIAADGIPVLVKIATTGWPADGHVADSQHPYDTVTNASLIIQT
jgi:hypothetical protein